MTSQQSPITYAAAGVDVEAGDKAVDLMKEAVKATHGPDVVGGFGGFAEVRGVGRAEELPRLLTLLPPDADARGAQGPDDELFELGLAAVVDGCVRQAGIDPA